MRLVQITQWFRGMMDKRPILLALTAIIFVAVGGAFVIQPLQQRGEAVAQQLSTQQALYDAVMANTDHLDHAAIDLRRLLFSKSRKPHQQYLASMNNLWWGLSPDKAPFLTDAERFKVRESVAEIGQLGDIYVTRILAVREAYATDRGDRLVRASAESDQAFRALRDRVLAFKGEISAPHRAVIAQRVEAADKARAREDLIFFGLLVCCLGLLVFFIGAQRRAVTLLSETRSQRTTLQAVVGGALDGVIMIDHAGMIELFSPSACRIFGVLGEDVVGRHVGQFLGLRDNARYEALLRRAVKSPERTLTAFRQTVTGQRSDGEGFPMSMGVSQTQVGDARKFVLIVRDISDEVAQSARLATALQDAQAASKAKSDFLTVISHELRTPLNGVLGMASALAAGTLATDQREMMRTIIGSGQHLLRLVNDLIDLSHVEGGELKLDARVFNMETLLTDTLSPLADDAHDKGLELSVDVEPAALGLVDADGPRLRQIICHLVGNAVKFTEKGEIIVEVARPSPNRLRITVTDTGIGFDDEARVRLFTEFEQADTSMTRRFGGSGLGLAICSRVVALMKGEIGCDSQAGEGSRFWFEVEAPVAADGAMSEADGANTDSAAMSEALRVLCVDDNAVNRRVVGAMLAPLGVDVTFAEDGAQAVEAYSSGVFDVILMDLQMPIMDGLEATRLIRKAEVSTGRPRTRIVAVSANCMPEQVRDCLAAGMDRHVAKPVQIETLYGALTESPADQQRAVA